MQMPPPPLRAHRWAELMLDLPLWRQRGLLMGAGVAAALALPPVHFIPLLWIAVPILLLLLGQAETMRRAFAVGWWFGFGHFSLGLYWIAHAFLVEPLRYGWMIPFALTALGAGMGVFIGLTTLLTHAVARRSPLARVLALAALWVAVEWLRSWVFTGFPWNLIGTVWVPFDAVLQSAAWIGTYGLSLVTLAAAGLPLLLLDERGRRGGLATALGLLVLAGLGGGGALRLAGDPLASGPAAMVPGVRLRLVQPDIPQALKWVSGMRIEHLRRYIELSRSPGFEQVTHVIWGETAVPYYLGTDDAARAAVATAAPPGGIVITGAPRRTPIGTLPLRFWNSLFAVDSQGQVVASYDKVHLVPFGEYMPLRALIPSWLNALAADGGDFSAGNVHTTLDIPGAPPADPLICYEIIFPGEVVGPGARPGWIVNLTNDAWFGLSFGPYQHFASARLRAVEEGIPVVRVANTGISAVTDGFGRVVASLGLEASGFVDSDLPVALPPTAYSRWGALIPLGMGLLLVTIGAMLERQRKRSPVP